VSFWSQYRFARSWSEVVDYQAIKHGNRASVGVFPLAPLQILD
jgi:hypothetical protein